MTGAYLLGAIGRTVRWALRAGAIAVLVVLALYGITDSGGLVVGDGNIAYVRGDATQRAQVGEVLARYGAAGFRLPFVVITYRPWDWCPGRVRGRAERWKVGGHIDICEQTHRAVAHELAHLYLYSATTGDERADFVHRRRLPTWNGREWDWTERATEHAANLIVWWVWDRDHGDYVYPRTSSAEPAQDLADLAWLLSTVEPHSFEDRAQALAELESPDADLVNAAGPPAPLVRVTGSWPRP